MRLVDEPLFTEPLRNPEVVLYRDRTIVMLKKYLRMSAEVGHLPALMGREFFRSHVSHYGTYTFEDTVIFVHDVEQCLRSLPKRHQEVIVTLFFLQYTHAEAARMMNIGHNTIAHWRTEALDALTSIFLTRRLLKRMPQLAIEPLDGRAERHLKEPAVDKPFPPKKGPHSVKTILAVSVSA